MKGISDFGWVCLVVIALMMPLVVGAVIDIVFEPSECNFPECERLGNNISGDMKIYWQPVPEACYDCDGFCDLKANMCIPKGVYNITDWNETGDKK